MVGYQDLKSDEFDAKMRAFEKSNDEKIRPEMYVICRIDGRNFSTLTRKILKLKPYDENLAAAMQKTVSHVMDCGFSTAFAYTQSDEISVLMDKNKKPSFDGKVRKYNSLLAAQASSIMSLELSIPVNFDCRLIQLPTKQTVFDYFAWRRADSEKNCLNMWCYYILTKHKFLSPSKAQAEMDRKSVSWKQEFLYQNGINFNNIKDWQKRGIGMYWREYEKEGYNPQTQQPVIALRRALTKIVLPKEHEEFIQLLNRFV